MRRLWKKNNFVLLTNILFVNILVIAISGQVTYANDRVTIHETRASNTTPDQWLINKFNEIEKSYNKGDGYSKQTNEDGVLGWTESYILESYVSMYEATSNKYYLDKFVQHADRVIANTDKQRNIRDYKGRSMVGWSATKYSIKKARVVHMVHTGMITYPLLKFAMDVKQSTSLAGYQDKADRYQQVASQAVAEFSSNWHYDLNTGIGYYTFDKDEPNTDNSPEPPMPVPFNQQLALGRSLIILAKLTSDNSYREKAEGLAKHFKGYLRENAKGAYVWDYWYGKGLKRYKSVEDISHATIDVDFAILAYKNGIVFGRNDIDKFVKTLKYNLLGADKIPALVDGTGNEKNINPMGQFANLVEFDCSLWSDIYRLIHTGKVFGYTNVMIGTAELLKSYKSCN